MMYGGTAGRTLFIGFAPAAVIAVILTLFGLGLYISDLDDALERRGASLAIRLAQASEHALTVNHAALQNLIEATAKEGDVSGITVVGVDGSVLASSSFDEAKQDALDRPLGVVFSAPIIESISQEGRNNIIGRVHVLMSKASILASKNKSLAIGATIMALGLGLMLFLAIRIRQAVFLPIKELSDTVKKLNTGDVAARAATNAKGELKTLEAGLNELADHLQAAQSNLENKIAEVTAQLSHKAESELQELTAQREAALAANRAKSQFLAAASHDLRQPLHALGLFSDALLEKIRYPEVRSLVVNISKSVEALENLFNSLLDISKLDAGIIKPTPAPFYLQTLFDKLERDYGHQARYKGLRFKVRPTSEIVFSDSALVELIARNLISNALAFTKYKGVLVGARKRGDRVEIQIWDTGKGIEKDQMQQIFQEFYQLQNPERDRSKGLGLGLAIVERLAKLLDSKLQVNSTPNRGSMFSFDLPISTEQPSSQAVFSPPRPNNLVGASIVIIDDERPVLEGMRALLLDWGCHCLLASSVEEALAQLQTSTTCPDLLIADYRLKNGATGIEAVKRLQALLGAHIPAILITGDTDPERLRDAKSSGYYLLHKPVRAPKLRTLLSYAMQQYRNLHTG